MCATIQQKNSSEEFSLTYCHLICSLSITPFIFLPIIHIQLAINTDDQDIEVINIDQVGEIISALNKDFKIILVNLCGYVFLKEMSMINMI